MGERIGDACRATPGAKQYPVSHPLDQVLVVQLLRGVTVGDYPSLDEVLAALEATASEA